LLLNLLTSISSFLIIVICIKSILRSSGVKKLRAKGLDQTNKQKMFPSFPLRVGLISASGSRALGDFVHQLEEGRFPGEIVFLSAPMQGEDVPLKLPGVFLELQSKNVDLIVLTRGGGSMADLRWFDAREVAMAIATCTVPVIAAIGHQDDLCVAEEISFLRAKTPTAAAEVLLSCFRTLRERLGQITHQLAGLLEFRAHQASLGLANLPGRIEIALKTRLDLENERLLKASTLMMHGTFQQIHRGELRLDEAATRLENEFLRLESALAAKDPAPWIDMGWTRLEFSHDPELKLSLVKIGDELKARLKTSLLHLEVKEVIDKSKPIGTQKN
jgi:exodeoxyribonuclease VII large subunit